MSQHYFSMFPVPFDVRARPPDELMREIVEMRGLQEWLSPPQMNQGFEFEWNAVTDKCQFIHNE